MRRRLITAASILATALGLGLAVAPAAHADGHGEGWYGVWASNVAIRRIGSEECSLYPSTTNCPTVLYRINQSYQVYIYCQETGAQSVGGNPYWVEVSLGSGEPGYMASYYVSNRTNWIDGVPPC